MTNRVSHPQSTRAFGRALLGHETAATAAFLLLATLATAGSHEAPTSPSDTAHRLALSVGDPTVRAFVLDALDRNPGVAAADAQARAARFRVEQDQALPDPVLGVVGYLSPPETRVGPQRLVLTLSQRFPWSGTRELKEQAALRGADVLATGVQGRRLELVTEVRRLAHEIAFLDAFRPVVEADRETLLHFEELARTRYASGVGTQQAVVRIQAEITKDDGRLLDIASRRATLVASLNALRDRPQGTAVPRLDLGVVALVPDLVFEDLRARALLSRPDLAQTEAELAHADSQIALAHKGYRPEFTLGVTYGAVSSRPEMGGVMLPPDNGKDIFGINLSVDLPLQRKRRHAGLEEAAESRRAAVARRRAVTTAIDRELGELVERLRLTGEQLGLYDRVLLVQAEQSLRAAEAGYTAGAMSSIDLLDAERVLLEVRTAAARTRADYAVALARLEGAIGGPLEDPGSSHSEGGAR